MKLLMIVFITCLSSGLFAQVFEDIMIGQDDLEKEMANNPNLVIVHVGKVAGYNQGHLPGAVYMSNRDFTITSEDSLYTQLPTGESFAKTLHSRGIDQNSMIILASDWEVFAYAFRLYFTLDYFGLANQTRILDGGVKGWSANNLEISTDTVVAKKASSLISLKPNKKLLVDKDWIKENYRNEKVTIIDARTDAYYSGETDGDGRYKRPGHIANSLNITWTTLVDENHFLLPEDMLKSKYDDLGIEDGDKIVNYCHVGLRATVLYTVGKGLGFNSFLYDGSYNEWDRLVSEYPAETSNK